MLPALPHNDQADLVLAHAELGSEIRLNCASGIAQTNSANVIGSDFCSAVALASWVSRWLGAGTVSVSARLASFTVAITQILCMSAEEKVTRTNTPRCVAMVANAKTLGNVSVSQFPRHSVGVPHTPSDLEKSVSFRFLFRSRPQPTRFGFVNLLPEALHDMAIAQHVEVV